MMSLFDELILFTDRFKQCDALNDCKAFISYPTLKKPTQLNQIVIATSIGEIDAKCIELGGSALNGRYELNANIYAPFSVGTGALQDIIEPAIKCQMAAYPVGIRVSEINVIEEINCFYVKCSFIFDDEICIGG